jgi:hypothetical protein
MLALKSIDPNIAKNSGNRDKKTTIFESSPQKTCELAYFTPNVVKRFV